MSIRTAENEQGLRKIIDMTRAISIVILLLHFYDNCYASFEQWNLTSTASDKILNNIHRSGLLNGFMKSKLIALGFLLVSLIGIKGRKDEMIKSKTAVISLVIGVTLYFSSYMVVFWMDQSIKSVATVYMSVTLLGFLMIMRGCSRLARIVRLKLNGQVFNKVNESFPQEERLLKDEFSLNLPATYTYKGKTRRSWINFLNPRRSILVMGSAGSGKTYFVVENMLRQLIEKGQVVFVFDQKFPDLTTLTYNHFLKHRSKYPANTEFRCVNFTDHSLSSRCNPIHPTTLPTLTAAIESAKSLLLSMNSTWANKQGEFFVESPINLLAAVIGFLRKYEGGQYCTLPHAIELLHIPYEKLFTILQTEVEIETLINPFVQAFKDGELETLNSQMASVKIPLGRISSPEIYYILSGDDFTLAINNPNQPKIFCLGNNPENQEALAPIMSLYIDRLNKMVNKKGKYPCAQVLDEFASARATSVMQTIFTGRANNITTIIAVQDYSQLKLIYSREEAESIFNIAGNIISGQVSGDTARLLSERFSKTFQDRGSISINSNDISISKSKQLDQSLPASTISSLSSGEFVGIVADDPELQIELKAFHCCIINDHNRLKKEKKSFISIPTIRKVTQHDIDANYHLVKREAELISVDVLAKSLR